MIFLLGGGIGFTEPLAHEFRNSIKMNSTITFIPSDPDNYSKYLDSNIMWFKEIGLIFHEVYVIDKNDNKNTATNKIQKSNVLFLMGGDPIKQLNHIKNTEIIECMKKYEGVIIGLSAGALSICKKCIIVKDEDYPQNIVLDGINITNGLNVDVHYENDHDIDLKNIAKENDIEIFGIAENCFIKIQQGNNKYIGNGMYCIFRKDGIKEVKCV